VVQQSQRQRFLSLDIFRGATVCLMIIVNTSTGTGTEPFAALVHAPWIGFTAADLVFPSFLFAIGNAMSFSDPTRGAESDFLLKIAKRAAILFLLGFLLYWYPFVHQAPDGAWSATPIGQTRVMGVLQRIALAFALSSLAIRHLRQTGLYGLSAALLLGYWAIMLFGGAPAEQFTKLGNAGTRFDLWLLGRDHLYRKDGGFDPEGLLGVLPSVVNVLAGYLAGRWLSPGTDLGRAVRRMLIVGAALALLGLAWAPLFPIAKKLWTSSYVLLTIGLDMMCLAALVAAIEIRGWKFGVRFFQIFGKNPLALYLFSELLTYSLQFIRVGAGHHLYDWVAATLFLSVLPGKFGVLLFSVSFMLVCWALGYWLDRKHIIIKI